MYSQFDREADTWRFVRKWLTPQVDRKYMQRKILFLPEDLEKTNYLPPGSDNTEIKSTSQCDALQADVKPAISIDKTLRTT